MGREEMVASFCGHCVSLMLVMPLKRYSTSELYWDMTTKGSRDRKNR